MANRFPQPLAHSANVAATLIIGNQRIALSKVSPNRLYFRPGSNFEAGRGTVELEIDNKIRFLGVRVLAPVVPWDNEVAISQI